MSQNITAIIDHIGRYIIGEVAAETESTLQIKYPVILHVQPNPQTNQLQIQTFPLFFNEFIKSDSRDKNIWSFAKNAIVRGEVDLDERIIQQYNNLVNPSPIVTPGEPQVVKLFED